jgi:beta-phosphoglucomutase
MASLPNRAVLFDFDGVIADTENVHIAAWERTFALLGWDVAPEVCVRAAEQDDFAFLAEVFLDRGIDDGDVAGWIKRKQRITRDLLASTPRIYPGVRELVAALHGKAQLAIVSGTWRENLTTVLNAANLDGAFSLILGKEDVERPKPDPEIYELALKKLRVKASSAVAIEDSPTGLASARAAGIPVVAVGHRHPSPEWAEGSFFVPNLLPMVSLSGWFS